MGRPSIRELRWSRLRLIRNLPMPAPNSPRSRCCVTSCRRPPPWSSHARPIIAARGKTIVFVLPSFAAQIARHQPVVRVGNLAAERDFLHVDDVVDAYLALLDASDRLGPRSVFNISSGVARPVGMLLDRMIALSGYSVAVEIDPDRFRPSDIPVAAIDSSVLRQKTGWAPTRAIDEMLAELLGAAEAERPGQPQAFPG